MTFVDRLSATSTGKPSDMRAAPRFALLLRAARLVGSRGDYLCIVRDVSETGVKLRLFHTLTGERRLALEGASGERIAMEMVWEHNGEAGFRFDRPIDVMRFIAEAGPYPKRAIRLDVDHSARITVAGAVVDARLRNLSRQGARIETDFHLAIGQQLRIVGDELPEFEATVCWRDQPAYGLVFRQLMGLEELAQRVFRMQAS
jgi:hypothetical protein